MGYKIYRFTETEIKKSTKKCINKIFTEGMITGAIITIIGLVALLGEVC